MDAGAGRRRDFDAVAATWDQHPVRVERTRALAEAMARLVPLRQDMRLLDYGCGTGLVALALHPYVASVVAADNSEGMLDELSAKLEVAGLDNVSARRLDLEQEDWTGEPFDVIVSSMALHHIRQAGVVVSRLAAALRPGGWLAIADLAGGSEGFHPDPTGVFHHGFSAEEMGEMFEAAGLTDVQTVEGAKMARETGEFMVLLTVGRRTGET
ncbi:class I SAM-dependent methyltransferase [bacterium]|nr:class I SAM-dependent methyltransferase [bacterium]